MLPLPVLVACLADVTTSRPGNNNVLLSEIVMGRAAAAALWYRRDLQAYSYINASLSETVFHALPHNLQMAEAFDHGENMSLSLSHALYTHLTGKLDAADGSYQAELLHLIWRTNPDQHIAGLQANHATLLSGGVPQCPRPNLPMHYSCHSRLLSRQSSKHSSCPRPSTCHLPPKPFALSGTAESPAGTRGF